MLKNTLAAIGLLALVALASAALFREFHSTPIPTAAVPPLMPEGDPAAPHAQPASQVGRYQIVMHPSTPIDTRANAVAQFIYLLDTQEGKTWQLWNGIWPAYWSYMERLDTSTDCVEHRKSMEAAEVALKKKGTERPIK